MIANYIVMGLITLALVTYLAVMSWRHIMDNYDPDKRERRLLVWLMVLILLYTIIVGLFIREISYMYPAPEYEEVLTPLYRKIS